MRAGNRDQWWPELPLGAGPIYLRLVEELAKARADGTLQPGDRLPPQRDIAKRMGVDLTTVTRAFAEARRRKLIDATAGRGTFVTPGGADEPVLDMGMNIPPSPPGLSLPALIRQGMEGLLKRSSAEALLSYHPGAGSPAERAAASLWISGSGMRLPVNRVIVGSGAQSLLAGTIMALTREKDVLLADSVTYPGFIALAKSSRRKAAGVTADDDGMRPDRLDEMVQRHKARLVYLNPTLHNPTTLVMSESRRHALADVARRNGLIILEDDPYRPLLPDPPTSFMAIAPELTVHVATLAKCISPFLRTAFLAAPSEQMAEKVSIALRGLTLMAAPLMTGLATEWIRSGQAREIVDAVRSEARARATLAGRILPSELRFQPSGLHAWLPLHGQGSRVIEAARLRGVAVSGAEEFSLGNEAPDAIRIALGATPSRERLADGLTALAAILSETSSLAD